MPSVVEVKSKREFDTLLREHHDDLILVDFFATWCGPCKIMGPKFNKLSSEFGDCVFAKVDVDEQEEIVNNYEIKVMPTIVFIRNGKQVDVLEGGTVDDLRAKISTHRRF